MNTFEQIEKLREVVYLLKHGGPGAHARALALVKAANQRATWWYLDSVKSGEVRITVVGGIPDNDKTLLDELRLHSQARIVLHLDSTGGSGNTAMAVARHLAARDNATAIVTGQCQSAAVDMLLGCSRRVAGPEGRFMIHDGRVSLTGTASELRKAADGLDAVGETHIEFLANRTGQPRAVVETWLSGPDKWFSAQEALDAGLIHAIQAPAGDDNDQLAFELARALRQLDVQDRDSLRELLLPMTKTFPVVHCAVSTREQYRDANL